MTKRQIVCLTCIAVVVVSGLGAAAPSSGAAWHAVHPGESIQEAVDAAKPGDTIVISPGTYRESVLVTKANLTLRGTGARTVLMPAPATTKAANACATAGNGICVLGTATQSVDRVTIRGLTLTGFKKNAIWATNTDRLTVKRVTAEKNGVWGIAQQMSTRGVFRDNTVRDNGDAGIFIANTVDREGGAIDTEGALVADNILTGNRIGVTVRRVRDLTVRTNRISENCGGIFVVGDESKPAAGAMTLRENRIFKNNKFCPGNSRLPAIQGAGIVLTGAEATIVRHNHIVDNVGSSPLSGGILLFQSFVGAQNTSNVIKENLVQRNKTADLINRGTGTGNTFVGNRCQASEPAGMC
ncbi:nitrous oxide reductase family maturation protein NosD [Streptomyces sp. NBC_00829]|uniref:right-handed parallel beta-helix repeat-containing protein n=1 Tax=Streptomyces sp. NBC_00829 TaxID=2903679 RepID=UPI00386CB521|nr:right-handed parallel beta-helix repeat-containing protein [Streptomyces sp. NBC_00829]